MPETKPKQLNVHLDPALVETDAGDGLVESLQRDHGWGRRETVTKALVALRALMDCHEAFAKQYDEDLGDLYMRLAREAPASFVEVPKEGVKPARAAGRVPVMRVDQWLVFVDPKTEILFAEEQGGQGRVGRFVDGEIKPLKLPTPAEIALN